MERADAPLLRSIWADPDDDVVRWVYADWLEENGQSERAEFMRVQLGLARDVSENNPLKRREAVLLQKHRKLLLVDLPKRLHRDIRFDRGFPYPTLCCNTLYGYRLLHQQHPFAAPLWHVSFTLLAVCLNDLAKAPEFAVIDNLGFLPHGLRGKEGLSRLLQNPHLTRVHTLTLALNQLDDTCIRQLTDANRFPQLRVLDLSHNSFTAAAVAELAGCPQFAELRELRMTRLRLGSEGVRAFAETECWPHIEELHLGSNLIGDFGLECLLRWPRLANVHTLHLDSNVISNDGIQMLAVSPAIDNLKVLTLTQNQIGMRGVEALVASPFLARIERMELHGNPCTGRHACRNLIQERFAHRVRMG